MNRTVGELLDDIDATELIHWLAFNDIDPIGDGRGDLQAGIVASTLASCLTSKHDWKPSDFIPEFGTAQVAEMTDDELYLAGLKLVCMMGGEVRKSKDV